MPNLKIFPELDDFSSSRCLVVNNYHGLYRKEELKKYPFVIYTCFGEVFSLPELNKLISFAPDTNFIILTARKYLSSIKQSRVSTFFVPSCYSFYGDFLSRVDVPPTKNITRHMLSLNFRSQWNRLALAQFLLQENLLGNCYFSYHSGDRFGVSKKNLFDREWDTVGKTWFNQQLDKEDFYLKLPILTELDDPLANKNDWGLGNQRYYSDTFFSFVNETYIDENWDPFFGEKAFKPIAYGHPFMIFSSAGACKVLQELGFETFGDVFDESYDLIELPQMRFEQMLSEVKRICLLDHRSLENIHKHLLPRLLHNQQCLYQTLRSRYVSDIEIIKKQIKEILQ
jgi:hypothetical protein